MTFLRITWCRIIALETYYSHLLTSILISNLREFNAHALGHLAEVAGAGINPHVSTLLPPLLSVSGDVNSEVRIQAMLVVRYILIQC